MHGGKCCLDVDKESTHYLVLPPFGFDPGGEVDEGVGGGAALTTTIVARM